MTDAPAVAGLAPQEDYVDGPSTDVLLGVVLEYRYTRGARYRLVFDDDSHHLTFTVLSVPGGGPGRTGPPPPVLAYRAREIRDGLVLVHWTIPEPGFHVTLTIDLTEQRIHVAAMMPPNRWKFFDTGEITSVERGGGRARPGPSQPGTAQGVEQVLLGGKDEVDIPPFPHAQADPYVHLRAHGTGAHRLLRRLQLHAALEVDAPEHDVGGGDEFGEDDVENPALARVQRDGLGVFEQPNSTPEHTAPRRARAYRLDDHTVATIAARHAARRPRLDELSQGAADLSGDEEEGGIGEASTDDVMASLLVALRDAPEDGR